VFSLEASAEWMTTAWSFQSHIDGGRQPGAESAIEIRRNNAILLWRSIT
jgi:hypothetical protein